jgi:type I restriction enzyme, S subunit
MATLKLTKKYDRYPKYKDSGVEWVGEIPEGWNVDPLHSVTLENKEKNTDLRCTNLRSLSYGNIIEKDIDHIGGLLPASFSTYQIIQKGHIVMRLTDLQNDKRSLRVGYVAQDDPGIITSAYLGLKFNATLIPKYAYYLLHAYDLMKVYYGLGGGVRQSLDYWELKHMPVVFPQKEEQQKIATYLDEKTALIDLIIEKKKKQIELLREKRAAIINCAVTKGLDPKAKRVDSGVEWIGKVPEGWEVKKLKYVSHVQASNVDKNTNVGDPEVLLCNYVDVYKHEYITADLNFMRSTATHDQVRKVGLASGDVLITKDSETADDIGVPALVQDAIDDLVSGYHLYVIKPTRSQIISDFLLRFLQSNYVRASFETSSNGVTRFGLGAQKVKDLQVLVPSVEEQERLAQYINKKAEVADLAMKKIEVSIKQLQEFKSALISHVVTGEVRV